MVPTESLEWLIENWRFRAKEHQDTALAQREPDEARGHAAFAAGYANCATELEALIGDEARRKRTKR